MVAPEILVLPGAVLLKKTLVYLVLGAAAWLIKDLSVLYYSYDPVVMDSWVSRVFSDRIFKLRFTDFLEDLFKILHQNGDIQAYILSNPLNKTYFMVVRHILEIPQILGSLDINLVNQLKNVNLDNIEFFFKCAANKGMYRLTGFSDPEMQKIAEVISVMSTKARVNDNMGPYLNDTVNRQHSCPLLYKKDPDDLYTTKWSLMGFIVATIALGVVNYYVF